MNKKLSFFLDNSNFKVHKNPVKKPVEIRKSTKIEHDVLKIVNNEICLDENEMFLNLNRNEDMEVHEDNEIVTSITYSKKRNACKWSKLETSVFYEALSLCGLEFTLISEIFADKNRKACRLKYHNESKRNGDLIEKALMNKVPFCPIKYAELKRKVMIKE